MEDTIVHLDQPRRLFFGIKAVKALSRACDGHGPIYAYQRLKEYDVETLERVLWAGLGADEPMVTLSLVAKRVEAYLEREQTLLPLFTQAIEAIDNAGLFASPKGDEPGNSKATTTPVL